MKQRTIRAHCRIRVYAKAALLPVLLCLVLQLRVAPVHGQTQSGINGTVTDPSQAVISQAKITVTNTSTGVVSQTATSTAGTFTVIGLIPGDYSVVVDATGFRKSVTSAVVEISKMTTVNLTLQPGAATETVNVTGSTIRLDTTSPEVGTTLEPELVNVAPIEIQGLARQIDSGSVCVNDSSITYGALEAPFGGMKESGLGQIHGEQGIRGYCFAKPVIFDRFQQKEEAVWYPFTRDKGALLQKVMRYVFGTRIGRLLT